MKVMSSSVNSITGVNGEPTSGVSYLYQGDSHESEARNVQSSSGGPNGGSLSRGI